MRQRGTERQEPMSGRPARRSANGRGSRTCRRALRGSTARSLRERNASRAARSAERTGARRTQTLATRRGGGTGGSPDRTGTRSDRTRIQSPASETKTGSGSSSAMDERSRTDQSQGSPPQRRTAVRRSPSGNDAESSSARVVSVASQQSVSTGSAAAVQHEQLARTPQVGSVARARSTRAARSTSSGGSTPFASAQASFCEGVRQRQALQQVSASGQPQRESMQGNGRERSLNGFGTTGKPSDPSRIAVSRSRARESLLREPLPKRARTRRPNGRCERRATIGRDIDTGQTQKKPSGGFGSLLTSGIVPT